MTPTSSDLPSLDLYGSAFRADPHAVLRMCREEHWCASTPIGTAVLRYAEVYEVLAHRQLRTPGADFLAMQGITSGSLVDEMRGFLLNADGEPHSRVRRLVSKAFTARRVEAFRPTMRSIAKELLASLAQRDRCEFVGDFADPFAMRVLCRFVGIPDEGRAGVERWSSDLALLFGLSVEQHRPVIETALANLHRYIDELLEQRRRTPSDDLLSDLIAAEEAGELLTDAELRSMVITLLSAGHDTVTNQLGNAMSTFLSHRDQWRRLADEPALAPSATEEVLRYAPATLLGVPRVAKADIELHGLRLAQGAWVLPVTGAANRDPRTFGDADQFDIQRTRRVHATFGGGIHYCLGAALARAELQEALPLLARVLVDPHATEPAQWRAPTEAVYGPTRLPLGYQPPPRFH